MLIAIEADLGGQLSFMLISNTGKHNFCPSPIQEVHSCSSNKKSIDINTCHENIHPHPLFTQKNTFPQKVPKQSQKGRKVLTMHKVHPIRKPHPEIDVHTHNRPQPHKLQIDIRPRVDLLWRRVGRVRAGGEHPLNGRQWWGVGQCHSLV